jgi:hypothetical protein
MVDRINSNNADTVAATTVTNHGDDEDMSCLTDPAYQPGAETEPESDNNAGDADEGVVDEEEEEPNWHDIMQHEPARTEVPNFLSCRERKEAASESYSQALDKLHDSVNKSAESLVEILFSLLQHHAEKLVGFEGGLTREYVHNDKSREIMEKRLEENAKAAQGMFANLLKRVSAPNKNNDFVAVQKKMRLNEDDKNEVMSNDMNNNTHMNVDGSNEDEEPNWGKMIQHEPAQTEVPVFLAGRERREAACTRFQSAIEDYHSVMEGYTQQLTQTVADLYNSRMLKLNEHEQILKQEYAFNDDARRKMLHKLQESSAAIQTMFQEMIMRVMLPNGPQEQRLLETGILTQATTLESP